MSLDRNHLMNELEIQIFEFKRNQKTKGFHRAIDFSKRMKPLCDSILSVFKNQQNENGEFYQQESFIKNIELLLNGLSEAIEDVGQRKTNYESISERLKKRKIYYFDLLDCTLRMALDLLKKPEDAQKIMYNYGKEIIDIDHLKYINANAKNYKFLTADELVFSSIGVHLHSLNVFLLDKQIKRANDLDVSEDKKENKEKFVASLKTFRESALEDLDAMKNESYTILEIVNSDSNRLVNKTTAMLNKLSYEEKNKNNDEQIILQHANELSSRNITTDKFIKALGAVTSVFLASLGFIIGAAIGLVGGAIKGAALCGVGAIIGAPVGLVAGAFGFGECVLKNVKPFLGINRYESVSRYLLFRSNPEHAAKETNKQALKLIGAEKPENKKEKEKTDMTICTKPSFGVC